MTDYRVQIKFSGDWHIGSGSGRPHDVDSMVIRDSNGLPFVPGRTLKGVLRDACETAAESFQSGYPSWVDYLFGHQKESEGVSQGALFVGSGHFGEDIAASLKTRPLLLRSFTTVKPGNALDEEGVAREDFLRFSEMTRGGCTLHCPIQAPSNLDACGLRLLWLGCRLLKELGGKRRRNIEHLEARLQKKEAGSWKDVAFGVTEFPATVEKAPRGGRRVKVVDAGSRSKEPWRSYAVQVHLDSPVVIPSSILGNVVRSLDHIPGNYLLPAVGGRAEAAGLVDFWKEVISGNILVTNATPVIEKRQSRPAPFCLEREKEHGAMGTGGIRNRWSEEFDDKPYKQVRFGYIGTLPESDRELPCSTEVQKTLRTHNSVEDETQTPQGASGVYTYEAIAAGQSFAFQVRVRGALAGNLKKCLTGMVAIGQSKGAEYGQCTIGELDPPLDSDFAGEPHGNVLTVWCLSTLLVSDPQTGAFVVDPERIARYLCKELGVGFESIEAAAVRTARVDGWNSGWSLPRSTCFGISAGSAFKITVQSVPEPSAVRRLNIEGIGERRPEGFGQVKIGDSILSAQFKDRGKALNFVPDEKPFLPADHEMADYLQLAEEDAWRLLIRVKAAGKRWKDVFEGSPPGPSQRAAILSVFRSVKKPSGDSPAIRWMDRACKSESRKRFGDRSKRPFECSLPTRIVSGKS